MNIVPKDREKLQSDIKSPVRPLKIISCLPEISLTSSREKEEIKTQIRTPDAIIIISWKGNVPDLRVIMSDDLTFTEHS